jgi:hypothetical protein
MPLMDVVLNCSSRSYKSSASAAVAPSAAVADPSAVAADRLAAAADRLAAAVEPSAELAWAGSASEGPASDRHRCAAVAVSPVGRRRSARSACR